MIILTNGLISIKILTNVGQTEENKKYRWKPIVHPDKC